MESSWFTLVCITAVYFAQQSHGVPRTPADSMDPSATLLTKAVQDPLAVQVPEMRDGIVMRQAEDNPTIDSLDIKSKSVKDSMKSKVFPRMAEDNVGVRKERVQENEERPGLDVKSPLRSSSSLKVSFPEDPKQAMVANVEDDSIRSKKSTSMQDSFRSSPHLTTVCIQVRSDHNNQVVCGPQVNEDKDIKPNHSPRFASQGSEYYQQSLYGRTSQNALPVRPSPASGMPQYIQQSSIPKANAPPAAAKGPVMYPVMRSEETSAISGQQQFQSGQPPNRLAPGVPSSVVYHRQYFQGGPLPTGASQAYQTVSPTWSAMRLNCMPDYYQLPVGSNALLRSASISPEFYQVGDQLIPLEQQASLRMAQDPHAIDNSLYVVDGQARQATSDQALSSVYGYSAVDPMLGAAYIGEDGRTYFLDESQARSAMSEEQMLMRQLWEQQYQRASSTMTLEQLQKRNLEQQEELKLYKNKMKELKDKLSDIEQRAAVDDVKVKNAEVPVENHAKPENPPSEDAKKTDPQAKPSKRQTNRNKS